MSIKANLTIGQGTDYITTVIITDDLDVVVNLEGYTGAAQIRKYYTSSTAYDFDVIISANTGEVTLQMTSNVSSTIEAGRYVYDVYLTDENNKDSRIMEGIVTITPSVTRVE
jgi:hypothetical protein